MEMLQGEHMAIKKFLWKSFLWANWIIIFYFWWQGSGGSFGTLSGAFIALGRLLGLSAAYSVLLQFFFVGRMPWLEKVFGLDKLTWIHQSNGKRGIIFLILHPIFLTLGYSQINGTSFLAQYFSFATDYEDVFKAAIGFWLFIIVVVSSIYVSRIKLKYESWYFIHLLVYLAIFLSFGHQIAVGSDLLASKIFYGYWLTLYALVFGSHLVYRFVKPIYKFFKHDFRVEKIIRENYNTVSVYITGNNLEKFKVEPGQFMIFRFLAQGFWWQAHPFSLSFLPNGKELRITVKELGDFTEKIKDVPVGTRMVIDGPYGIFTDFFGVTSKKLFIAGGIGITPIRSLLEKVGQNREDAKLLYANKTEKDIVFKDELRDLEDKYGIQTIHVLSDEPGFEGEKGFLDAERIKSLVPDLNSRDVYLCGPPPMMDALIAGLKKLGFPLSQLHFEKFSLR